MAQSLNGTDMAQNYKKKTDMAQSDNGTWLRANREHLRHYNNNKS